MANNKDGWRDGQGPYSRSGPTLRGGKPIEVARRYAQAVASIPEAMKSCGRGHQIRATAASPPTAMMSNGLGALRSMANPIETADVVPTPAASANSPSSTPQWKAPTLYRRIMFPLASTPYSTAWTRLYALAAPHSLPWPDPDPTRCIPPSLQSLR